MLRSILVIALVMCLASSVSANIKPGDGLLTVNGGWIQGELVDTDKKLEGNILSVTFEKLDWGKMASFGFNIGYSEIVGETGQEASTINHKVKTVPMYLGGKAYLAKGGLQPYVGLGLGIYFSTLETTDAATGELLAQWSETGFGLGVPIGLTLSLGKTLFLNGNYTLWWLWSSEAIQGNILNSVNVGLGFNFGP